MDRSDCMGRSRGGLTTKIHAVAGANGMLVTLRLSAGQAYDGHSAFAMLDSLEPGNILLADRAYDADNLRAAIAARGAWTNIPPMPQRRHKPAFRARCVKSESHRPLYRFVTASLYAKNRFPLFRAML